MSQLAFDYTQTVAYELRGADGNLVLVLYPLFVVHLYQGVQYVFCPGYGCIVDAHINDGGFLAAQFDTQCIKITVGCTICFAYGITDGNADAGIAIEFGRRNEQSSRCSLYGVAHPAGKGIFRFRSGNLQTGNGESILGINPNGEADRFFHHFTKCHRHRIYLI